MNAEREELALIYRTIAHLAISLEKVSTKFDSVLGIMEGRIEKGFLPDGRNARHSDFFANLTDSSGCLGFQSGQAQQPSARV